MKREIKFRGLRTDGKGWVYGSLVVWNDYFKIVKEIEVQLTIHGKKYKQLEDYPIIPQTLGQFTGLKDKNGKEIYEGDICSGHSDGNGIITWTDFDGGYDYVFEDEANVGLWEVKRNIEIIGNIHES